ncbi:hypothetical protein C8R46DRAFT_1031005 [Mycena filopes]|nr:hypothetical protein C8R46DRAFT_1031005 [Mycena filopes]
MAKYYWYYKSFQTISIWPRACGKIKEEPTTHQECFGNRKFSWKKRVDCHELSYKLFGDQQKISGPSNYRLEWVMYQEDKKYIHKWAQWFSCCGSGGTCMLICGLCGNLIQKWAFETVEAVAIGPKAILEPNHFPQLAATPTLMAIPNGPLKCRPSMMPGNVPKC